VAVVLVVVMGWLWKCREAKVEAVVFAAELLPTLLLLL
jgi:hypothetical protein